MFHFLARLRDGAAGILVTLLLSHAAYGAELQLPPLNDPPTGLHLSGKLVWADLVTPDPDAARRWRVVAPATAPAPASMARFTTAWDGTTPITTVVATAVMSSSFRIHQTGRIDLSLNPDPRPCQPQVSR